MVEPRKRRIVRRFALTVVGVALAATFYVASCASLAWLEGRQIHGGVDVSALRIGDVSLVKAYGAAMLWYCNQEYPGHRHFQILFMLCYERGSGAPLTWSDIAAAYDDAHAEE